MKTSFQLTERFNQVDAETLYRAWLDSAEHSRMTGGTAVISSEANSDFSAWDGYISGKNIELHPFRKIVQAWRSTNFLETDEDSLLTIEFTPVGNGCKLVLTHSDIPENQPDYLQGWQDHYFEPMQSYFDEICN